MKRFLKLLPLALLLCLALCLLSSCEGEIEYEFRIIEGGCEIAQVTCSFLGDLPDVLVIPAEYAGVPVISIGENAFEYAHTFSSTPSTIVLPDTVKEIKASAFQDTYSREIILPEGLERIGDAAFCNAARLTEIVIPASVVEIGESAFGCCESLASITVAADNPVYTTIDGSLYTKDGKELIQYAPKSTPTSYVIPEGVERVPEYAFAYCKSLTSITLPESITKIGERAFDGCSSLVDINIPAGVTEIGYRAFEGCTALERITLPDTLTELGHSIFSECTSLREVTLPSALTALPSSLFYNCTSLTSLNIPAAVTAMGSSYSPYPQDVFEGCTSLTELTVAEDNPIYTSIDGSLYSKDGKTLLLYNPGSKATSFTVPDGTTTIGKYAFHKNATVEHVTLPEGVVTISEMAFAEASALRSISLPKTLLSIEDYAFYICDALTELTFPSSLIKIGNYAFMLCDSLERVYIPSSVKTVGVFAFRDCGSVDIYAEAEKRPDGWHRKFKPVFERVDWGYTGS